MGPRSVPGTCCLFIIRLLTTWFTVDSTNPVEIRSPFRYRSPIVRDELSIVLEVAVKFAQLLQRLAPVFRAPRGQLQILHKE
jgi:hypothetical protein